MKRLTASGYEANWYDITDYIASFGILKKSYGDTTFLGSPQIDGTTIVLNNAERKFNRHTDYDSLFYGYQSRYRTKFKLSAGFVLSADDAAAFSLTEGDEYEAVSFYGILYSEPVNSDDGTIKLSIASVLKAFENYPAYGVAVTSATTAGMVDRLCKLTKSGVRIFDQYFEGATDGDKYKINTGAQVVTTLPNPSVRANDSVWKKLGDYSTIDNFFANVNSSGNFTFESKTLSTVSQYTFNGAGSNDTDYGTTIISVSNEVEGYTNTWGRVTIEHTDNTFETSAANWYPGDGTPQDLFGERTWSESFFDLDSSSAATVAARIRNDYQTPKREWTVSTVFIPQLEVGDTVTINYIGQVSVLNPFILGVSKLGGADVLAKRLNSINLIGVIARIASMEIDLDSLTCTFRLREA